MSDKEPIGKAGEIWKNNSSIRITRREFLRLVALHGMLSIVPPSFISVQRLSSAPIAPTLEGASQETKRGDFINVESINSQTPVEISIPLEIDGQTYNCVYFPTDSGGGWYWDQLIIDYYKDQGQDPEELIDRELENIPGPILIASSEDLAGTENRIHTFFDDLKGSSIQVSTVYLPGIGEMDFFAATVRQPELFGLIIDQVLADAKLSDSAAADLKNRVFVDFQAYPVAMLTPFPDNKHPVYNRVGFGSDEGGINGTNYYIHRQDTNQLVVGIPDVAGEGFGAGIVVNQGITADVTSVTYDGMEIPKVSPFSSLPTRQIGEDFRVRTAIMIVGKTTADSYYAHGEQNREGFLERSPQIGSEKELKTALDLALAGDNIALTQALTPYGAWAMKPVFMVGKMEE